MIGTSEGHRRGFRGVIRVGASVVLAGLLMLTNAWGASAIDERHGERVCWSPNRVRVNSFTTTAGSPTSVFSVAHAVGHETKSWRTPGSHGWRSNQVAGSWLISTTGTITSHGTACSTT